MRWKDGKSSLDYPGLITWVFQSTEPFPVGFRGRGRCDHGRLLKEEAKLLAKKMEKGGQGARAKECGCLLEAAKGLETFSPKAPADFGPVRTVLDL